MSQNADGKTMGGGGITLSAAERQTLLALQQGSVAVDRTQKRLASGLRVAHAEDDPVAFFTARALGDRASDLLTVKDGISSAISTIKSAMDALDGMEALILQMRGLALAAKSAEPPQRQALADQFNELRGQLDTLAGEASYQGLNLLDGGTLNVRLNENGAAVESSLTIAGSSVTAHSLGIAQVAGAVNITESNFNNGGDEQDAWTDWLNKANSGDVSAPGRIVEIAGLGAKSSQGKWASQGTPAISASGGSFSVADINAANVSTLANALNSYYSGGGIAWDANSDGTADTTYTSNMAGWNIQVTVTSGVDSWSAPSYLPQIDTSLGELEKALATVRSTAAGFASNIATLQVRTDFTRNLVDSLREGQGKLVNTDLDQEGATLVTLQTRAQLGVSALSFAARFESSVVSLFS